jgi:hypothetical protein
MALRMLRLAFAPLLPLSIGIVIGAGACGGSTVGSGTGTGSSSGSGSASHSGSGSGGSTSSSSSGSTSGSGSGSFSDGGTCSFEGPIPSPPSLDGGTTIQSQAEATQLTVLDTLFGRYLRGDVKAYRGAFQASDNYQTVVADGGAIAEGPGIGSLEVATGTATLTLHSVTEHAFLSFQQSQSNPSFSVVGVILSDGSTGGDTATCTGCLPNLFQDPNAISLTGFMTTGFDASANGDDGENIKIYASGSLTLAPPCSLDLPGLVELAPPSVSAPHFAPSGSVSVWHVNGSVEEYPQGACMTETPYTIDLYVNPQNLADYGVMNYQQGTTGNQCPP